MFAIGSALLDTSTLESMLYGSVLTAIEYWNGIMDALNSFLFEFNFLEYFDSSSVITSDPTTSVISGAITTMIDVAKGPAIALAMLFWFWGLFKQYSTFAEMKRPEVAVKSLIRFALVIALIESGPIIVSFIWSIATSLSSSLMPDGLTIGHIDANAFVDIMNEGIEIDEAASSENVVTDVILVLFASCLPIGLYGTMIYCTFNIVLSIFRRLFFMGVYTVVSPLALSSAAYEGTQRTAVQFGKNVVATSVELSLVTLIMRLFSMMSEKIIANGSFMALINIKVFAGMSSAMQYSTSAGLALVFMIFLLNTTIKQINNILDSLFGLRGV